jgi:hypothetical protein
LAGIPGGQAGGLVHYALYEPGEVLYTEKLLFQIYFNIVTFLTISRRRGHVEDGSRGGCPRKCIGARLTLQIYHGRSVNARLTLIRRARRSIGHIRRAGGLGGRPAPQTTLIGSAEQLQNDFKFSFLVLQLKFFVSCTTTLIIEGNSGNDFGL